MLHGTGSRHLTAVRSRLLDAATTVGVGLLNGVFKKAAHAKARMPIAKKSTASQRYAISYWSCTCAYLSRKSQCDMTERLIAIILFTSWICITLTFQSTGVQAPCTTETLANNASFHQQLPLC